MVRLALYKGRGQAGNWAIRTWTNSIYSHCELVIDGMAYSSSLMDGGVRAKCIDFNPEHWDFIDLPWADEQYVLGYFSRTDDDRYGLLGLITAQLFNLNHTSESTQFCSQWCANALRLPSAAIYNPKTLGELCARLGEIQCMRCGAP